MVEVPQMVVLMIDGHGESQHQPTVQLTQQWQNAPAPVC
jgi:hypothetical protein